MSRVMIAAVLGLTLASTAFARKCCVCCEQPCEFAPVMMVPPADSAVGCDDVRQAPTCRGIRPARCQFRMANGVEATEDAGDAAIRLRQEVYSSEELRHVPEIWERAWALEMPDLATPYRTHGGKL